MLDVNVMGVLLCMNAVLGGMYERKSGIVLNVSSIAGRKSFPNHAVYCGTKFAVHALTETIREEASKYGVRCTTIAPGVVETELLSHTTDEKIIDGYKEWKKDMKVLEAVDIARSISFAAAQPPHVCIREIVIGPTAQGP
jgi:NADP-dependent 3-hydroxy acid dehydrogenase YdfG